MEALVSQIGGAQQSVHDSVYQNVAVAVPSETVVVGDIHSAQN